MFTVRYLSVGHTKLYFLFNFEGIFREIFIFSSKLNFIQHNFIMDKKKLLELQMFLICSFTDKFYRTVKWWFIFMGGVYFGVLSAKWCNVSRICIEKCGRSWPQYIGTLSCNFFCKFENRKIGWNLWKVSKMCSAQLLYTWKHAVKLQEPLLFSKNKQITKNKFQIPELKIVGGWLHK